MIKIPLVLHSSSWYEYGHLPSSTRPGPSVLQVNWYSMGQVGKYSVWVSLRLKTGHGQWSHAKSRDSHESQYSCLTSHLHRWDLPVPVGIVAGLSPPTTMTTWAKPCPQPQPQPRSDGHSTFAAIPEPTRPPPTTLKVSAEGPGARICAQERHSFRNLSVGKP